MTLEKYKIIVTIIFSAGRMAETRTEVLRMKIDWKRKLTSRKLWLSVASFVTMLIIAFGVSEEAATQVSSIIMAGASVIGYVIGEGLADSGNGSNSGNDKEV